MRVQNRKSEYSQLEIKVDTLITMHYWSKFFWLAVPTPTEAAKNLLQ